MESWERVGRAVRDRRLHLGWTQQEAADHSGVSLATWRLVELGGRDRYQDLTLRGVSKALGWPNDAMDNILAGGDPPDPTAPLEVSPDRGTFTEANGLPSGFARKYLELSIEERGMVQGFIDGLMARRSAS
jgi:transcriptional regulator with XRE-family HTH domain